MGENILENPENITLYLENLCRLRILKINANHALLSHEQYAPLINHPSVTKLTSQKITDGIWEVKKGHAEVTALGKLFIKTCVAPPPTRKENKNG